MTTMQDLDEVDEKLQRINSWACNWQAVFFNDRQYATIFKKENTPPISSTNYLRETRQAIEKQPSEVSHLVPQEPVNRNRYKYPRCVRCLNAFYILGFYTISLFGICLGAINLNNCPDNKMLPILFVLLGVVMMIFRLLKCKSDYRSLYEEYSSQDSENPFDIPWLDILNWCTCGVVLIIYALASYSTYSMDPTTKPEDHALENYCDNLLYKTSYFGCGAAIGVLLAICKVHHESYSK